MKIHFVVTVANGVVEWDCPVHDPSFRPILWSDIEAKMKADPKCPFKKGQTLTIKSNWQKENF